MQIHVVAQGETIQSIAESYNIPVTRLIMDNGIENPNHLVIGQSIVIVYPEITYTVKEGDTLNSIASTNGVSPMQLMMNNPEYLNIFVFPSGIILSTPPLAESDEGLPPWRMSNE